MTDYYCQRGWGSELRGDTPESKLQTPLPLAGNREAETQAGTLPYSAQLAAAAGKFSAAIMKRHESVSHARG